MNQPVIKNRVGRFQISIWKKKRVIPAKNDYDIEREYQTVRACIQYSRINKATEQWENQSIWCNPEDLKSLAELLNQLHGQEPAQEAEPK